MSLTYFYYSDGTTSSSSDIILTKSSYSIPPGKNLINVDIGTNVTSFGNNCFDCNSNK